MQKVLIQERYANLTIDSAKQTAAVFSPKAEHIAYVVVASSASSPTGTTLQIQGSIDGDNWANLNSTVSVTGNGTFTINLSQANASYSYYRLSYARTGGSYVASTTVLAKGEEV
jgi:hypothetical protein